MANSEYNWPLEPHPFGYVGTRPKGARDRAWRYAYEGPNPGTVICIKCEKIIHGGINRLKYHIASIEKHDARVCRGATDEIKKRHWCLTLSWGREEIAKRAKLDIVESQGASINIKEEVEALQGTVGSRRGPRIRKPNTTSATTSASSSRPPGKLHHPQGHNL